MSLTPQDILNVFISNPTKTWRRTPLRRALNIKSTEKVIFKEMLRKLVRRGDIEKKPGGHYNLTAKRPPANNRAERRKQDRDNSENTPKPKIDAPTPSKKKLLPVKGYLSIKEGGFGFVLSEDSDTCVFIPKGRTHGALHGDLVEVEITEPDNARGPAGKVLSLIEAPERILNGEAQFSDGELKILPLRRGFPAIQLDYDKSQKLDFQDGDWIKARLEKRLNLDDKLTAHFEGLLGPKEDLGTEIAVIVNEFDLQEEYSAEEETRAGKLKARSINRQDLTNETIITVDPFDAKDFDDALSIHAQDDKTLTIGVHIADVAAYITPRGKWHKMVRERAFTAYLPGRTIPMLPHILVKKRCSLTEAEERPAHTVLITVEKNSGKVIKSERFHSTVLVKKRLNYQEVMDAAQHDFEKVNWGKKVCDDIRQLFHMSRKMRAWRKRDDKFIPLEAPEVRVLCDINENKITGLKSERGTFATQMVEEMMLAANTAVAQELAKKDIPGLYRIHPEPDDEALMLYAASVEAVYSLQPGDLSHRKNIINFLNSLSKHPSADVISYDFLRAMQRASYDPAPSIHYGLGKGHYLHFTSPIRRLSDLIVHQQLWDLEVGNPIQSKDYCLREANYITRKEADIDEAYRTAISRLKLYYLKDILGGNPENRLFDVAISAVNPKGLRVYIKEMGMYSFLPLKTFTDDYYNAHESEGYIKGRKTGREFRCGDVLSVELTEVDLERRDIRIMPVISSLQETPRAEKKLQRRSRRQNRK